MLRSLDTSVVIVGAGPVGLTLAMELASRGVDVIVTETRRAGEPPNVKCNQVSARSMEIFRRLGLADRIRDTGLPSEYRNDVAICVSVFGTELSRIKLPSRAGRLRGEKGADGHWPCAEWGHRINQLHLEPLLFRARCGTAVHPYPQPHPVRGIHPRQRRRDCHRPWFAKIPPSRRHRR